LLLAVNSSLFVCADTPPLGRPGGILDPSSSTALIVTGGRERSAVPTNRSYRLAARQI